MAMMGYCQSAASATVAETPQVEAHTATSCLSQQLWTDHQWLLADHTNLTHRFKIASGKAHA